ncbi:hypothetical protein DRO69_06700 [Candidatus Bathyarchaeota archaeon]|nr:MAG: hypothetical protein DRO69_06700 [Candidatus Bathyarchaeota archaeon]
MLVTSSLTSYYASSEAFLVPVEINSNVVLNETVVIWRMKLIKQQGFIMLVYSMALAELSITKTKQTSIQHYLHGIEKQSSIIFHRFSKR